MNPTYSRRPLATAAFLAAFALPCAPAVSQQTPDCTTPALSVAKPTTANTATEDFWHMLCLLGIKIPDMFVQTINGAPNPLYVSRIDDPNRPVNSWPTSATATEGNFRDALAHTMVRNGFGEWTSYLDSTSSGAANPAMVGTVRTLVAGTGPNLTVGGAIPTGGQGDLPGRDGWQYTPIDLLKMDNGDAVLTPDDWWTKRRPEIWENVQKYMYGRIPDRSRWPSITWVVTNGSNVTVNGIVYAVRTVAGTIGVDKSGPATSSLPNYVAYGSNFVPYAVRNRPSLSFTVRVPLTVLNAGTAALAAGQTPSRVPALIAFGTQFSTYTSPVAQPAATRDWAAVTFANGSLQPDSGSATSPAGPALSSYIIGLINEGNWRQPEDWGALAAWSWGISRFLDYLENGGKDVLFINPTRTGVEGHSRYGKATIVAAAYDSRILAAFPSCSGEAGAHMNRRQYGETHESVGGTSEYYWVCGNWMLFNGSLVGADSSIPRKKELMPVDGHSVVALVAPRAVFLNGGTDTPAGNGDAWQDPQGMYMAGVNANPVYNLLGRQGLVTPPGTVFTSGSGEALGGTPTFGVALINGHVGWRRHIEGHTDTPDLPTFVTFAGKFLNDVTPPVLGLPANQTVLPTGPAGAQVTFADPLAMDAVDDQTPVTVSQASGSTFPIGVTTVTVTSKDVSGNTATDFLTITVTPMTVTRGGFVLNRLTNRIYQTVTLRNVSPSAVSGPIYLALDALSGNTSLLNAAGSTGGSPYVVIPAGSLAPGASVTVQLQFANPTSGGITYNPRTPATL